MNALERAIAKASQKYYTDGSSDVSDAEWDRMLDELKETTPDSPLLTDVGHGYDVNLDTTPGAKVEHKYGMIGSLNKCHNYSELDNRLKGLYMLWASLKLDGLSVVLYFYKGNLYQALTRGRNDVGIDITPKVNKILGESMIQDSTFTGAVRGEILMSHENFLKFQSVHPEAENARNSSAGLINASDISDELSYLDIVVYSVVGVEGPSTRFLTYTSMRSWLEENFKHVVDACVLSDVKENGFESNMFELQSQWYGEYPADGIVLSADDLILSPGKQTGQVIIYKADAFKFPAEQVESTVLGVEWTLSKTKYMIPVAQLSPVRLAGTTVKAATGISAQYIRDNQIGEGAQIIVEKANEIIPKIIKIQSPGKVELPTNCPACNSELKWSGVHLQCMNDECSGGDLQDTLVWLETISPCERLGDKLKTKFLEELFGSEISLERIYSSKLQDVFPNDLSTHRKMFADMYKKLFTNKVKLCDAIKALNIPRFGDVNSRKLAEYPDDVKWLLEQALFEEPLKQDPRLTALCEKIGDANFKSLITNLRKLKRLVFIDHNIIWEPEVAEKGKVAITGKLSVSRSVFETELRNAGYSPGNISKDTKFLITDSPFSSSSKNKFADDHGIQKVTEEEFRSKYM